MPLELVAVPCLADNFAYLIHDAQSGQTAVIDVPEPGPILSALKARKWQLSDILITHHHPDHIDGVDALRDATGAKVHGAAADAHRLPRLDHALTETSGVTVGREVGRVIDVPGHTVGHIAFYFPESRLAFTADSLMAGGCGRLFEGTPAQMHASLKKLAALPPDTLICSGHEYTLSNLRFALSLEPDRLGLQTRFAKAQEARSAGRPTVPSLLAVELATNPYLRVDQPALKAAVGMPDAEDVAVFAEIRARKDKF